MKYRMATLLAKKAYTTDAVETIPIRLANPISLIQILLKVQHTGYVEANSANYTMPVTTITKIELVDGSETLFSLTGQEAQAVDFYHNKVVPANETRHMNDGWSNAVINLNFGRYLWDPLLALDPSKLVNPELKITFDINPTGFPSDNARMTVTAMVFDEKKITPIGFLMHKQIKSYDLADTAHEYINMPVDHPYRKLFIKALRPGYLVSSQIDAIKLSQDVSRKVILDDLSDEIISQFANLSPRYSEHVICSGTTGSFYCPCTPAQRYRAVAVPWTNAVGAGDLSVYTPGGGRIQFDMTAAVNVVFHVEGHCPHGVIEIPFGLQNEIDDWFNVSKGGSLELDITGGADTGSCQVLLQQLRKY
jgi:hypothetical protein